MSSATVAASSEWDSVTCRLTVLAGDVTAYVAVSLPVMPASTPRLLGSGEEGQALGSSGSGPVSIGPAATHLLQPQLTPVVVAAAAWKKRRLAHNAT